ncbi:hypothetical protein ABWH92_12200 [Ahrensia marina]|uniref:hypothetical protein n=1 Tax=Ahrensia marina TaxID=1514904 RepID=UPI0035CEDA8B
MTGNHLDLWEKFADIDPKFTKEIKGKPYKGTSPNPHYVVRCLTEMFGPVGQGFGWEVTGEGFQPLGEEVLHWCRIRFWHGEHPGFDAYGQTKALTKTRNGLQSDEDAPKKSLTDAITKAAAQVGVGANIFLGRWDDSKYVAEVNQAYRDAEGPQTTGTGQRKPDGHNLPPEEMDHLQEYVSLVKLIKNQATVANLEALGKTDRFKAFCEVAPISGDHLRGEYQAQKKALTEAELAKAA